MKLHILCIGRSYNITILQKTHITGICWKGLDPPYCFKYFTHIVHKRTNLVLRTVILYTYLSFCVFVCVCVCVCVCVFSYKNSVFGRSGPNSIASIFGTLDRSMLGWQHLSTITSKSCTYIKCALLWSVLIYFFFILFYFFFYLGVNIS